VALRLRRVACGVATRACASFKQDALLWRHAQVAGARDAQRTVSAHARARAQQPNRAPTQEHFARHAFLLGSRAPSIADFGFMGPLAGHLAQDPLPSCMLQCTAPLVSDYVERLAGWQPNPRALDRLLQHGGRSGSGSSSGGSSGGVVSPSCAALAAAGAAACAPGVLLGGGSTAPAPGVVGLAPADPQQPQQGRLVLQLAQPATSSSSSDGARAVDEVPPCMLQLLHHMFQEQVPVMQSALRLLQAWAQQQQQQPQQPQQQQQQERGSAAGSWRQVPRFLGRHTFTLFDPQTGRAASSQQQRVASSYTAWRAAEVVAWYLALAGDARAAVHQLLLDVSAVGGSGGSGGSSSSVRAVAGSSVSSSSSSSSNCGGGGGGGDGGAACPQALGSVDAVAAFGKLVRLVQACGRIERQGNKVVVWVAHQAGRCSKL
jgi:hypothetical protein